MANRYSFLYTVFGAQIPRNLCMKNFNLTKVVFLGIFCSRLQGKVVKQEVIASTKEIIHGKQFVATSQMIDGVKHAWWSIDGQSVDKDAYKEAILDAEKEERRQERERQYLEQEDELAFQQRMRQTVLKKLLGTFIVRLEGLLAKIRAYNLQSFIGFGQHTFTQEQYDDFMGQVLPHMCNLIKQEEPALTALQQMVDQAEEYEKRMKRLVQEAIETAIHRCDDTVMLKRLLNIV